MHLLKSCTVLILLFSVLACDAQLQSLYPFQQDDTLLKQQYYAQSGKKKELLLAGLEKKHAADYKKIYEDHFSEIGRLWKSTRIVTAPEAHHYLQSVVQKIKSANPELAGSDARVVFSRDWWPNAVSMGDGSIAINAGLMVYLSNEAELAFVLCHEMAHYYLDHTNKAIRKYVETVNSESYQQELKRLSKTEYGVNKQLEVLSRNFAFSNRRHSRENETAADRLAFHFMKNTGYDCQAIRSCLELLDKVDDANFAAEINIRELLNFPGYPFRQKWIKTESAIFSELEEGTSDIEKVEKDSLKTHPDCSKRIALLSDSIGSVPAGRSFLVDEKVFTGLKKSFFIEMSEQCFREKNLSRNLYYSLLLLQSKDQVPLAVYSVARNLNAIYDFQKNHALGSKLDTESKGYPADYNLLLRMLGRLRLEEIAAINLHFCRQYENEMKGHKIFEEEYKRIPKP